MYVLTISVNKHFKDKERLSHRDYQQVKDFDARSHRCVYVFDFASI